MFVLTQEIDHDAAEAPAEPVLRDCYLPASGTVGRFTVVPDGAVPLPLPGAAVDLPSMHGRRVQAAWVHLVPPSSQAARDAGQVTVRLLSGSEVVEHPVLIEAVHAARSVVGSPPDALAAACTALAQACARGDALDTQHERWKSTISRAACAFADEHELCGRFDDFMADWGLPTRQRDYDVEVTVSGRLSMTVTARDADDALERICRTDVLDRLREDGGECLEVHYDGAEPA